MPGAGHIHHARRRAWQRYGLALHATDLQALAEQIAAGGPDVTFVRWSERRRHIYQIHYRGRDVIVVYDPADALIISFLPWACRHSRRYRRQRH